MKIVASGMSGLIGRRLGLELAKKHELVRLIRRKKSAGSGGVAEGREVLWSPGEFGDWTKEIDGADAVINLCGEPIAEKRWTAQRKALLKNSRIQATQGLTRAIGMAAAKPKVFLNASAIGYYGSGDNFLIDENARPGVGFLADLCLEWEREARNAEAYKIRVVLLRTGIVLSKESGALKKMLPPFRWFLGGPLGNGKQFMSWIHIDDEVNAILAALDDPMIRGPVNLTAPNPVTMDEFANALGRAVRRPALLRVPAFVLKTLLGEMADMLLTGQKAYPQKLKRSGFEFLFPTLEEALKDLFWIQKRS